MRYDSIGQNMRKYRLMRKMRQEDLAEKADLSTNYIGALERCEKIPSLETFINIVNVLGVSADMLLVDVQNRGYEVKTSLLSERIDKLSAEDRECIYDVVEVMVKHAQSKRRRL